jgi:DNA-binding transcriptional LysR family regulator
MNIRALRAFVELVKQKSYTHAADALCVTQPTISKLIKMLETDLDLTLMIRNGHQFELTPVGQLIYTQGTDILQRIDTLDGLVKDYRNHETGILKIGMPPTVGQFFYGEILAQFHDRYPLIQIQLYEDGSETTAAKVLDGSLDVGSVMLPVSSALATRPFVNDALYFITRKPSAWQHLQAVQLGDIHHAEFVLFTQNYSLSRRLESAFAQRQYTLNVSARSSQWQFMRALVQASQRAAIMPATIAEHFDEQIFHKARIIDADQNWHLSVIWRPEPQLSKPLQLWLELCDNLLPTLPNHAIGSIPSI